MRKLFLLFLPLFAASCGQVKQQAPAPEPVNVMSFNIRYDNPEDSLDNWQYRKDRAANAIRFYDVDILGTQEVLHNQLEDLKQRLPEYGVIGVGREDGKEKGEYSALWYKKDRFNLLDSGYFWLSETPEVAGSKGWDGACERIASWAKLQDKVSGKEFFALNTHLDHVGVAARREGISLMLDKVNDERVVRYLKGETLVLTDEEAAAKDGWQLVCVEDYPLGWGKKNKHNLKNKYHSGWRMV